MRRDDVSSPEVRLRLIGRTWNQEKLNQKGFLYWFLVVSFILVGFYFSFWLSGYDWWQTASYKAYNAVISLSPATATHPSHTALVLIDDDDYWLGDWARRQPLKRHLLANLLRKIHEAGARAIGVDVDLRCQKPDGSISVHGDYADETNCLLATVYEIARDTPVVLGKSIGFDERLDRYVKDADVFDKPFQGYAFVSGYTRLPHDVRQVALNASAAGINADSFASVIGRVDPLSRGTAIKRSGESLPFIRSFFDESDYKRAAAAVSAGSVLKGDPVAMAALKSKIVIVGGNWHRESWGRGDRIDKHLTPRGEMPGAVIHANYIEAILSEQMTAPSGEWLHFVVDLLVGISLAVVFACAIGYWKIFYLLVLVVGVALLSLVAWANAGIFLDAAPPMLLLAGHAAGEKILEWKRAADAHSRCASEAVEA
jgi:CHASE2 domain-containing sensor protein